jgi:hypothetical protein
MKVPYANLPAEQATWTRQQVEEWLSTRTPEQVFGHDVMEKFAEKYAAERNLVPADRDPVEARIPPALLPALGVVATRKNSDDPRQHATACVFADGKAGTLYATDLKLLLSVAADANIGKGKTPQIANGIIPKPGGRIRVSFGAGPLFKLVLSALASTDDGVDTTSLGRIDFFLDPEKPGEKIVRVEVVDGDDGGTVRMVGAISPLATTDEPDDDRKLRPEATV